MIRSNRRRGGRRAATFRLAESAGVDGRRRATAKSDPRCGAGVAAGASSAVEVCWREGTRASCARAFSP